ncbi:hypothetical protein B0T16DRAFT_206153 [Cercophora newfieldiana]|uniref:Uncharacterized protein n=1 Tax=Cercophora newfieldiana TaxID=92897 RepID=A0AA39XVH6_9PEZI|nr:hypothetical protein B0T16DRAFT_206153 [Cercophora newfieldiana]
MVIPLCLLPVLLGESTSDDGIDWRGSWRSSSCGKHSFCSDSMPEGHSDWLFPRKWDAMGWRCEAKRAISRARFLTSKCLSLPFPLFHNRRVDVSSTGSPDSFSASHGRFDSSAETKWQSGDTECRQRSLQDASRWLEKFVKARWGRHWEYVKIESCRRLVRIPVLNDEIALALWQRLAAGGVDLHEDEPDATKYELHAEEGQLAVEYELDASDVREEGDAEEDETVVTKEKESEEEVDACVRRGHRHPNTIDYSRALFAHTKRRLESLKLKKMMEELEELETLEDLEEDHDEHDRDVPRWEMARTMSALVFPEVCWTTDSTVHQASYANKSAAGQTTKIREVIERPARLDSVDSALSPKGKLNERVLEPTNRSQPGHEQASSSQPKIHASEALNSQRGSPWRPGMGSSLFEHVERSGGSQGILQPKTHEACQSLDSSSEFPSAISSRQSSVSLWRSSSIYGSHRSSLASLVSVSTQVSSVISTPSTPVEFSPTSPSAPHFAPSAAVPPPSSTHSTISRSERLALGLKRMRGGVLNLTTRAKRKGEKNTRAG